MDPSLCRHTREEQQRPGLSAGGRARPGRDRDGASAAPARAGPLGGGNFRLRPPRPAAAPGQ